MLSSRRSLLLHTPIVTALAVIYGIAAYRPAFAQQDAVLDTIVVTSPRAEPYKADAGQLDRLGLPLLDTPASLSVVTNEAIVEQRAEHLSDVLRNVANIRTAEYFGGYQTVYSRGFFLNNQLSFTRDGLKFPHFLPPPRRSVDRYEVLKGVGGLDYGQVSAGGLVNYISKRPNEEIFAGTIDATVGSNSYRSAGFDVTGPFGDSGLSYRFTGSHTQDYERVDALDPKQRDLTASLRARINRNTVVDFDYELVKAGIYADSGFPIPASGGIATLDTLSAKNFYGERTARFNRESESASVRVVHDFGNNWVGRIAAQRAVAERESRLVVFGPVNATAGTVGRIGFSFDQRFQNDMVQADLQGKFSTGSITHKILLGTDFQEFSNATPSFGRANFPAVSLTNPVSTGTAFVPGPARPTVESRNFGVTAQDYIQFNEKWAALAGARWDDARFEGNSESVVSPSASLIYSIKPDVKVYATRAKSFEPNNGSLIAAGVPAPASQATLLEAGVKTELNNKQLRLGAALYELTKTNVTVGNPAAPQFVLVSGEQRSRGVELEAVGRITDRIDAIATFGIGKAEVTEHTNAALIGNKLSTFPERTASIWTTWRPVALPKTSWSLGAFYTGARPVGLADQREIPSSTVVDAAASYNASALLRGLRLQANVHNLFNKRYYEAGNGNGEVQLGLERRFSVTASLAF